MNTAIALPTVKMNMQATAFIAPKLFSAKRFVDTRNLSQAEWLEVRRQGIGSSDCAAACGLNPYMSMLELWMIKTGRVKQSIEDESEGHAPLYWGKQNLILSQSSAYLQKIAKQPPFPVSTEVPTENKMD